MGNKVKALEDQLGDIDDIIKESDSTTATKIMKLQEGIADERDQLYQL